MSQQFLQTAVGRCGPPPPVGPRWPAMDPLQRSFCWPQVTVAVLIQALGVNLLSSSLLCRGQRATSFFSGLGTSELAWSAVGNALVAAGLTFSFVFTFACERDAACHEVLLKHNSEHVFADILDLFELPARSFSLQMLMFLLQTVPVRRFAHCVRHGGLCPAVPGHWTHRWLLGEVAPKSSCNH